MRKDHEIIFNYILESDWDDISFVACATLPKEFYNLRKIGIDYKCYDLDPKFKYNNDYIICDPIFDPVRLGINIVNFNTQKMYPIGKIYKGNFILCGNDINHPGDCNPITSTDQLISQNNISIIYDTVSISTEKCNYHLVWGSNN